MASWPPAPSTMAMVTTTGHGRPSPHRTHWLRSLTAADTCAAVRVCVGRRLVPAGPPAEERKGGREGRERPGLPRIWVGTGPASRVAHAPYQRPDRPDKRGPDRVQDPVQFHAQFRPPNLATGMEPGSDGQPSRPAVHQHAVSFADHDSSPRGESIGLMRILSYGRRRQSTHSTSSILPGAPNAVNSSVSGLT